MSTYRYSDRACSADATFRRISPVLKEFGITRLAKQTNLDHTGIPVWSAIRPNSKSLAVNQGKGLSEIDAKVSAMMEAVERATAEAPPLCGKTASFSELEKQGHRYDLLKILMAKQGPPITAEEPVEWVRARHLVDDEPVWVPLDALLLDRTRPNRFWLTSDGLASGNTEQEAIFHGVLERIERDADVIWNNLGEAARAKTVIDIDTFEDPELQSLMTKIRAAKLDIQMFDLTSDIGIPVFLTRLYPQGLTSNKQPNYIDMTQGMGAHPFAVRAIIRAVTEAVQSKVTLTTGTRDDVAPGAYREPLNKALITMLQWPSRPWTGRDFFSGQPALGEMLEGILDLFRQRNLGDLMAVRLNPYEQRFAVVRILATGLENPPGHRKHRFGPRALIKLMEQR